MSLEEVLRRELEGKRGGEAGSINYAGPGEGEHCKDFGFHSE